MPHWTADSDNQPTATALRAARESIFEFGMQALGYLPETLATVFDGLDAARGWYGYTDPIPDTTAEVILATPSSRRGRASSHVMASDTSSPLRRSKRRRKSFLSIHLGHYH